MIIRKYKLYKESNSSPTLERFAEDLYEVSNKFGASNSLYGNSLTKTNRDPNSDLNMFKQRMLTKGWSKTSIIELFQSEENITRYVDSENVSSVYQMNGLVDIFLMYCETLIGDKKYNFEYGGGPFGLDEEGLKREAVIKYEYGCHKTKYGKLANSTLFESVEQFKKMAFDEIDELMDWTRVSMLSKMDEDYSHELSKFIKKDESTLSLIIDMKGVFGDLQMDNIINVEYEDFVQDCINYFGEIFDDYEYVRTDLILKM